MTAPGPSLPLDALEDVAERIARHDPDALEGLDRLEPASGMAAAWVDGALWMARHVHGSAGRAELGWRLQQLRHQVDTSQPLPDRVAALLAEMCPAKIRYSSMSIPYHIGAGYLGGFLPLIACYIVAMTGNAYSGLWYTWGVVAFGLLVAWWGLPNGPPKDFEDAHA